MAQLCIVIPVYRVEATLNRCIESVVGQDYADMEVILVDDGSPDRCPQLCDEWAARDPRVRVIHKRNGGLSDARNAGIEAAQAKYITFVDSDDYLGEGTYRPLMQVLESNEDIDILEYPAYVYYGSPRQYLLDFPVGNAYSNMREYWYEAQGYLHTYAWNKIYKRSLFAEVRYPVGVIFEDVHTMPLLLQKAGLLYTINQGLYHYCQNPNGITATADGNGLSMLLQPHVDIIRKSQRRDKAFQTYYLHVLNIQMDVCELTGDAPILPQLPVSPSLFNGLPRLKAITLNLLGIKRLCSLNKIIHKVWRNR